MPKHSDRDINIQALPKPYGQEECFLHPDIPQGSALFVAPTNSGKTTLIVNMLLRISFGVLLQYKRIIIMSPTIFSDDSWDLIQPENYSPFKARCPNTKRKLKTAEIELYDELNEPMLERLLQKQLTVDAKKRKKVLVIIDDFAADFRNTRTMARLAMRGRHSKVWLWLSTQMYRKIPRTIRVNMPYYIFFTVNTNELKTISEELATTSIQEFEKLFNQCTSKLFDFFTIDMKKRGVDRYSCSFKKIDTL